MPAEVVVGIIGVETFYGRITGSYRVIDALATLAFDFPAGRSDRSAFFRGELEEFFVLCAREGLDPQALKGSFAGAIGLPQFMPGSVNRWAVDHDGDGHVDLQASAADAVGSVAHYLQAHGWQPGLPTHYEVARPVDAADRALLLGPDIVPTFSAAQFAERGAVLGDAGAHTPARWPWWNCTTASARPATWPARRTSTPSRATTSRATTRWRSSNSAAPWPPRAPRAEPLALFHSREEKPSARPGPARPGR